MPSWVRDETLWTKAKAHVRHEYPDIAEGDDRFWRLVTGVYKQSGGVVAKAVQCDCKQELARVTEEGRLMVKSRGFELSLDGAVTIRCPKCKAPAALPDVLAKALLGRARLVVRRDRLDVGDDSGLR